jgi:serine/threonine-protein kinase
MAERYKPLFRLDSGGMAEVYVAEAESVAGFKKKVAIKRILPGLLKDDRFVRMFLDEARLSLYLNHANTVSVFDIGKSESAYFIVMEYIEGTNLKAMIERRQQSASPKMPIPLTVWTLNEILKGLDYAHRLRDPETGKPLNLVHRDVSPPNVLISWNGEVKLTDFGLAKATTQLESTDPGVVKGKFSYLAPEAAHGLEVDRRADIFAAGIIGWEMLAGRRLFLADTDYQTVEMVRRAQVPSLTEVNPDVREDLERILSRALAREPSERYSEASEFADDLLGYLFATGQKFSAHDLSGYLAEMRDEADTPKEHAVGGALIMKLLDDEILSFTSLDDQDDNKDVTGARPLDEIFPELAPDPPAPSPHPPSQAEREVTPRDESLPSPEAASTPLPRDMRVPAPPTGMRAPSPAPRPEFPLRKLLWTLVFLAAVGGGFYWFLWLGNWDKLL